MNRIIGKRKKVKSTVKRSVGSARSGHRKKWITNWIVVISVIIFGIFLFVGISNRISDLLRPKAIGTVRVDRYRDLNAAHLRYASRNGIKPFKSDKAFHEGISDMVRKDILVKISDNRYYMVRDLSHSHPYLTPKAAQLLNDIGARFRKKLGDNNKPDYYFQISSLLRTGESQRRLGRSNRNASRNSSHLYGTTFDIAYKSLIKKSFPGIETEVADGPAIKLLSEAIGELRKEGRCKVVTEYYEKCFHITVAR